MQKWLRVLATSILLVTVARKSFMGSSSAKSHVCVLPPLNYSKLSRSSTLWLICPYLKQNAFPVEGSSE